MSTEIFDVTKIKLTGGGIMKLVEDLRQQFPSKPHAMNAEQKVSKIMHRVVKKSGLSNP